MIRLVAMGWSADRIAHRLGMTVDEVQQRLKELDKAAEVAGNGIDNLSAQWLTLCQQYDQIGHSLVAVGQGLGNLYSPAELEIVVRAWWEDGDCTGAGFDPESFTAHLLKHCIILKPYLPVDTKKIVKDAQDARLN